MEVDSVAVLGCPEMDGPTLRRLSWALEGSRTDFIVAPALLDVAGPRIAIRPVCGLPLLHVEQPEFSGMRRIVKAAVDRAAAGVALLLLTPVLLAIAAAVKASSPGPVLFRQVRVGRDGSIFTILKFRTMTADAEQRLPDVMHLNANSDGLLFKIPDDPRLTRVGRVLRRYSLDELPQLLNVLAGSMSLVGPRPPLPTEVEQYHLDLHRRLLVKPGLTGLWQISGRADLSWDEAVRLDLRYVENWSLTLDLLILWKTVAVVLRGRGAY
jgi:exopolysaccharide biosynthesis polyprenyl glycosylphosphotransferase